MNDAAAESASGKSHYWLLIVYAALGLVAAGRVLYATAPYGPGVSGDSLQYFAAALDIAHGDTIKGWQDGMFVSWPPLYPALLHVFRFLGTQVETARWLNTVAAGLTVFLFGVGFLRHIRAAEVRVLGAAMACTASQLFSISVMVWSEPIFVLLIVAQLSALMWFLRTRSVLVFLLAAVLAAAACMQRYPGVTLIGVSGLAILFPYGNAKWYRRIVEGLVFGAIAATPLALWLKRNKELEGIATSWAGGEIPPMSVHIQSALETAQSWLLPASPLYRLVTIVLLVIVVPPVLYAFVRSGIAKGQRMPFVLNGFFAFVYVAFLFYSSARYIIEPISDRYLAPVYLSLLVVAITILDQAVRYWRERPTAAIPGTTVAAAILIASAASMYYPFLSIKLMTAKYHRDGVFGYTRAQYVESPLVASAREQVPLEADVYTNNAEILFVNTGIASTHLYESDDAFRAVVAAAQAEGRSVYLVWFASAYEGHATAAPAEELLNAGRTLAAMPEGAVRVWDAPNGP